MYIIWVWFYLEIYQQPRFLFVSMTRFQNKVLIKFGSEEVSAARFRICAHDLIVKGSCRWFYCCCCSTMLIITWPEKKFAVKLVFVPG